MRQRWPSTRAQDHECGCGIDARPFLMREWAARGFWRKTKNTNGDGARGDATKNEARSVEK